MGHIVNHFLGSCGDVSLSPYFFNHNDIPFKNKIEKYNDGENVSKSEFEWFFEAAKRSLSSLHPSNKVCAILLCRNKEVAWSVNSNKSHPFQAKWSLAKTLHAEIGVIKKIEDCDIEIRDSYRLVIARIVKSGIAPSYPCPVCKSALEKIGLTSLICSDMSNKIRRININSFNYKSGPRKNVLVKGMDRHSRHL